VVGSVELKRGGGYAELAVAKKTAVALKAPSLSFIEAAPLPIAGYTARDEWKLGTQDEPPLALTNLPVDRIDARGANAHKNLIGPAAEGRVAHANATDQRRRSRR
jgi:hypothetical protein